MAALKFRVLLDSDKKEEIFRDILIDENEHFETLYKVVLSSFNFEGIEIGSFFMSNDDWDKGHEISLMDMRYSDEEENLPSVMNDSVLKDFMEVPDQKIILVYDFLRMWIFLFELIEKTEETVPTPKILLSIGIAPPEDSRLIQDESFGEEDFNDEDDSNEFEDEFEDGYNDEDFGGYEEYEY